LPLEVRGTHARHVLAFARRQDDAWVVVVAGRLLAGLGRPIGVAPLGLDWADTRVLWPEPEAMAAAAHLPWLVDAIGGRCHALVDGGLELASLLTDFPVAALSGELTRAA
jgi:(1->4)-alpha-D-glucan 1-alpha-D-glucosylmutase